MNYTAKQIEGMNRHLLASMMDQNLNEHQLREKLQEQGLSSHATYQLVSMWLKKSQKLREQERFVNDVLHNDENSSDADLNVYFQLEGLTRKQADYAIRQRDNCSIDMFYWVQLQEADDE
jgi:hypothetical protein